jgi:hypothetical protein
MKISKALLLSIIKLASAEDAADDDKLAEHVRANLDGKKMVIGKRQALIAERQALVADIAVIDSRLSNIRNRCTHELVEANTCLVCGATV